MTTTKKICAALATTMLLSSAALAADSKDVPSEINADAIEYDMNTGLVAAAGNILIKHGDLRATGLQAVYNVNTKEAYLIGNVIVIRDDVRITCNALSSLGQTYMAADGNVVAVQTVAPNEKLPEGDVRTFNADHIDYYPDDKKHVIIPKGGIAQSAKEGTFTADQMEGWLDEEHYIGKGNTHIVSPPRNLEAGGDQIDYFGQEAGKAILSGNAWAIQNNNTIRGNRLTVYLADDGNLKATPVTEIPIPEMPDTPELPEVDKAFKVEEKSADEKVPADEKIADEKVTVDETSVEDKTLTEPEKNSSEGDKS